MFRTEEQVFQQLTNSINALLSKPTRSSADMVKIISEAESMFEQEGYGLFSAFTLSLLSSTYTSKTINRDVRLLKFVLTLDCFSSFLERLQKESASMFGSTPFEANISISNGNFQNEVEIEAYFAANDCKILAFDTGARLIELYDHRRKTDKFNPRVEKLDPPDSLDILQTVNQRLDDTDVLAFFKEHDLGIKNYLHEKGDLSDHIDDLMLDAHGGDYHTNLVRNDYIKVYEEAGTFNEKSRLFYTIQKHSQGGSQSGGYHTVYLDIDGFAEVVNAYKKITPSNDLFYIPLDVTFGNRSRNPVDLSLRYIKGTDFDKFYILYGNAYCY
ncbi:TPA: hypothetical protein ACGVAJ_002253 [Vibrio vulnificus]|nr:hypothetical protein [Vibrio vulnificus]